MPLGALVFVATLQFTFVNEGWPFRRLSRVVGGFLVVLTSCIVGLAVYFLVVNWHLLPAPAREAIDLANSRRAGQRPRTPRLAGRRDRDPGPLLPRPMWLADQLHPQPGQDRGGERVRHRRRLADLDAAGQRPRLADHHDCRARRSGRRSRRPKRHLVRQLARPRSARHQLSPRPHGARAGRLVHHLPRPLPPPLRHQPPRLPPLTPGHEPRSLTSVAESAASAGPGWGSHSRSGGAAELTRRRTATMLGGGNL